MKVSELIDNLKQIKKDFGDVEVKILDPDSMADGLVEGCLPYIVVCQDEEGVAPTEALIVDAETAMAFDE